MKIVMLEQDAVNNDDICFDGFNKLGDFKAYPLTPDDKIIQYIGDADAVLCNKCRITRKVMQSCKNLKYIGECATGYNNIDIDAANELGITVTNAGQYSTNAVAQHVFAFILNHLSKVSEYNNSVHNGDWVKSSNFVYYLSPTEEINGLTLGIVGFGSIGKAVCRIANAFGMKVIVYTRTAPDVNSYNCEFVSKEELFTRSDFITLHCPLTDKTENLVNKETLGLMKKSAYLINTSRGPVVNEKDLSDALNSGVISGAALDVVSVEPMRSDNPLLNARNCVFTPHIAWAPRQTRERLVGIVLDNLLGFINGNPKNVVTK